MSPVETPSIADAPAGVSRDVCQALGGLFLDGANTELLGALHRDKTLGLLAERLSGDLAASLFAMQESLALEGSDAIAIEYTRLFIVTTEGGKRRPLLVAPWEDCWLGSERRVLGERSRAVFGAYVAAGLGFDEMKEQPSDHIGLELCFAAALLEEEAQGQRDRATLGEFLRAHLGLFAPKLGEAVTRESKGVFWSAAGRALAALPTFLGCPPKDEPAERPRLQLPVV